MPEIISDTSAFITGSIAIVLVYSLRAPLHGVSPMVWRRLRVHGSTSLANLHCILQTCFGWDDEHLHCFHIHGKDFGLWRDGGLAYTDDARQVALRDFAFDAGDRFHYEYNFFANWRVDIRIKAVAQALPRLKAPFCLSGHGMPGVTTGDAHWAELKLVQWILAHRHTLTKASVRRRLEKTRCRAIPRPITRWLHRVCRRGSSMKRLL